MSLDAWLNHYLASTSMTSINSVFSGPSLFQKRLKLRLARFLGMTPDFWMNLQLRWDLYHTQEAEQPVLERIQERQPLPVAPVV